MNAIRGAIFVDENTKEDILGKTQSVLEAMIQLNSIQFEEIISIMFSATDDLTKAYPAIAARELGIVDAALFCAQEMFVEGSSRMCIRVLMHLSSDQPQHSMKHAYLNGAEKLRPDLAIKQELMATNIEETGSIFSIAVDGPAGAGKSSIAKEIAKRLNIIYIDTGAMYRGVALYCAQQQIDFENQEQILQGISDIQISITHKQGQQHVILNGIDVSEAIRSNEISIGASKVSVIQEVREKMVELQRTLAKTTSVIMDGRDIGTHVLKDATLKIYLEASVDIRAKRRYDELVAKGIETTYESIEADIIERDHRDMTREFSPLVQAEDAIRIDTSELTINQVVDKILEIFGDVYGDYSS